MKIQLTVKIGYVLLLFYMLHLIPLLLLYSHSKSSKPGTTSYWKCRSTSGSVTATLSNAHSM